MSYIVQLGTKASEVNPRTKGRGGLTFSKGTLIVPRDNLANHLNGTKGSSWCTDMITVSTLGQLVRPRNGWTARSGKLIKQNLIGKIPELKRSD